MFRVNQIHYPVLHKNKYQQPMKNHIVFFLMPMFLIMIISCKNETRKTGQSGHEFNDIYTGENLNHVAFPIGGIGAGMVCLEGTGCISHVSVRNRPDLNNEPLTFAAITIKGDKNISRVLEGPVPEWKIFCKHESGNGLGGTTYGLPRFESASFLARFPFGIVTLSDQDLPIKVVITGWSPFIPGDPDNSSLPVGALEYTFINNSGKTMDAVFSFNTVNFMRIFLPTEWGSYAPGDRINHMDNGFILHQEGTAESPHIKGDFAIFSPNPEVVIDHCWFRGGWWDPLTMTWKNIETASLPDNPPCKGSSPGASIYLPFTLEPDEEITIPLLFSWYIPESVLTRGSIPETMQECCENPDSCPSTFVPWYAFRFSDINDVAKYWLSEYQNIKEKSLLFRDAFYEMDLPAEVIEAVAANLTILKSTTVLRQHDGNLWCWEGCHEEMGCCHGSCTHVWNYAQALPHLFPSLERSLRNTEFFISQNEEGHQTFRSNLPISPTFHNFYAAADGQLGGIVKVYREWRISGDRDWLEKIYPELKASMNYCIYTWDPKHKGVVEEPHHNTYDIEFWGPDGMCTGFYLGALNAIIKMGNEMKDDITMYQEILNKGITFLEDSLYNGEYFYQIVKTKGLVALDPVEASRKSIGGDYSPEAAAILEKEGPKYQYGNGCISDGVLGFWLSSVCGLDTPVDIEKIKSHLNSVYRYNMRHDLSDHVNPQRPAYAMGTEGGLLLCTWPEGDQPSLPFVYSNEVWTGIEYQVASHLMMMGMVKEGLDIVKTARKRYDGRVRNPFDEFECGHWYARAMSSYGLLQGLTGIRYDAVEQILYLEPQTGKDFTSFISTATGFGNAGMKSGKPFIDVKYGEIPIKDIIIKSSE
jgi:uncharacterized protein (DUF608 family)